MCSSFSSNNKLTFQEVLHISQELENLNDNLQNKLEDITQLKKKLKFINQRDPSMINRMFYESHKDELSKSVQMSDPSFIPSKPKNPINQYTLLSVIDKPIDKNSSEYSKRNFVQFAKDYIIQKISHSPHFQFTFRNDTLISSFYISKTHKESCLVKEFQIAVREEIKFKPYYITQNTASKLYNLPVPIIAKTLNIEPLSNFGNETHYCLPLVDFLGYSLEN